MDIDDAFLQFHQANPQVYTTLVALARQAVKAGKRRGGMKMFWEVMRWQLWMASTGSGGYQLNNNFTSRYARLIEHRESDLAGFFEMRGLRS